ASSIVTDTFSVASPLSMQIDLRYAQFTTLRTDVHPNAVEGFGGMYIDVLPWGSTHGLLNTGTPDLMVSNMPPGTPDGVYTFAYADPLPPSWPQFVAGGANFSLGSKIPLPDGGTSNTRQDFGSITTFTAPPPAGATL